MYFLIEEKESSYFDNNLISLLYSERDPLTSIYVVLGHQF